MASQCLAARPPQGDTERKGIGACTSRGVNMLVSESHQYGGTWVFYVIAPIILLGSIACLWWIVKGAIGVFGPGAAVGSQKASPLKAVPPPDGTALASLLGRGTGRASSG